MDRACLTSRQPGGAQGQFAINEAGNAVFSGAVAPGIDGSFSAVRHDFEPIDSSPYHAVAIGLKGDGRRYQLRVEPARNTPQACVYDFQTSGEWETIEIPFADMLPAFPGQALVWLQIRTDDGPGPFRLEIDRIWLK